MYKKKPSKGVHNMKGNSSITVQIIVLLVSSYIELSILHELLIVCCSI